MGCGTTSDVRAHNKEQRHARNDRNRTLSPFGDYRERETERESRTDNKLRKKQFKYSTVHCAWHSLLGLRDFSKWQCNDDWAVR